MYTEQKRNAHFVNDLTFYITKKWGPGKSPPWQEALYISSIFLDQGLRHIGTDKQGLRNFQENEWE